MMKPVEEFKSEKLKRGARPTSTFQPFNPLTLALLLFVIATGIAASVDRWIGVRSYPPTLTVAFSNLPPAWAIETSTDLTNWLSVMKSGDLPPQEIEFAITNANHAQYYRVTELE